MSFKFETFEYADVNSRHMSDSDKELLNRLGALTPQSDDPLWHVDIVLIGTHKDETWFVGLRNDFTSECKAYLIEVGFTPQFAELMEQLAEQRIYYVRLDDDGYDIEGAHSFE